MKKIKILIIIIIPVIFLNACSTIKDGFRSQKKDSVDEFLVEKKSPLVMPPDFDELPMPNENQNTKKNEATDIKSLISNNENSSDETLGNSNENTSFENSILKKIKKN
jgi:PBP1b-binding outer membrane lipoprotein LpoB